MIADGFSGICGVRKNINGKLYLLPYGYAIAVNVDPMEKKPLFHFLPGERVFSFGTVGCNFKCEFCQNWDISQTTALLRERYKKREDSEKRIAEVCSDGQKLSPEEIVDYCSKNGIPAIAYTYNEPTIFAEYAGDTGKLARTKGLKNIFVSNGYESADCLKYMQNWCDAINIDIKGFSEKFYNDVCGGIKLEGVLETVKMAYEMGFWIECTTLIIPDLNDSDEELKKIAQFIAGISADIPWHVSAFHGDYKMTNREITPKSTLERAVKIGHRAGLKYVYSGNISGMENENTFCPKCGEKIIEREGVCLLCNRMKIDKNGKGFCFTCGEKIAGVWK